MSHKKNFRLTRRSLTLKRAAGEYYINAETGRPAKKTNPQNKIYTCYLEALTASIRRLLDEVEEILSGPFETAIRRLFDEINDIFKIGGDNGR